MAANIKKLEGRDHYVCPVVMIVGDTILNGSAGPVYYPSPIIQQSVRAWNAKPVVVYHPNQNGLAFADSPEVFNRQKIGTLFNTRWEDNRLKGEAWIDVERVRAVHPSIEESILRGNPVEVSTGLVVHQDGETNWQGAVIAKGLEPDHLAVLPTGRGACSLADGSGLMVNAMLEMLPLPTWGH